MLGKLTGIIDEIYDESIILDVGGVGYLIYVPDRELVLLNIGDNKSFYISTYVREDSLRLYGFLNRVDTKLFNLLQEVPKVGAKLAFSILGFLGSDILVDAILESKTDVINKVPAVGKKVSERIILELKAKLKKLGFETNNDQLDVEVSKIEDDAISALVNLGYNKAIASSAVNLVVCEKGKELDCATLLRYSLRKINEM